MKKAKNIFHSCLGLFLLSPLFLFAANAGNPLSTLKGNIDTEIDNTTKTVMGIMNTISISIAVAWFILCLILWKFAPERGKEHLKTILSVGVIIGLVYGITTAYM